MISLSLLSQKDVISIVTGQNIGRVDDIEFSKQTARVKYLIVFGRPRWWGLFGREEDIRIPWENVITIGKDAILVNIREVNINVKKQIFHINFD